MSHMSSKRAAAQISKDLYSGILQNIGIDTKSSKNKTPYQLERYVKGVANHHRISILFHIAKNEGITLDQITQKLNGNFKTMSEHRKKLTLAGLIDKKYIGNTVTHSLTPYGKKFHNFLFGF